MAIRMHTWVRSIIAASLVAQAALAGATLITQSNPFSSSPADVTFEVSNVDPNPNPPPQVLVTNTNNGPQDDPQTLTFNLFNPALGTLNSVKISYTSDYSATATLVTATNGNAGTTFDQSGEHPDSVDFFADGALTIKLTGGLIPDQLLSPDPTVTAQCLAVLGPIDGGPAGTCNDQSNVTSGNFNLAGGIPGLSTASFLGSGTFDLTATLSSALTPRVDPDNGTDFADNATFSGLLKSLWSGSVTVDYDYTPTTAEVPEPVTLYLLLAGLGGIALSRRRRC